MFVSYDEGGSEFDAYGLPICEYPGLVKVHTYAHTYVHTTVCTFTYVCMYVRMYMCSMHIIMCCGIHINVYKNDTGRHNVQSKIH